MSTHRQIKFRFWSGSKMFYDTETVMACLRQQLYFDEGNKIAFAYDHIGLYYSAFMAFTGLTDCKGVEVYEGDIVQVKLGGKNHTKLIIKYLGRSFVMGHPEDDNEMDCVWYYDFKVIGNIYETKIPTP